MNIALMRVYEGLGYEFHLVQESEWRYPVLRFVHVLSVASLGGLVEEMSEEEDRVSEPASACTPAFAEAFSVAPRSRLRLSPVCPHTTMSLRLYKRRSLGYLTDLSVNNDSLLALIALSTVRRRSAWIPGDFMVAATIECPYSSGSHHKHSEGKFRSGYPVRRIDTH